MENKLSPFKQAAMEVEKQLQKTQAAQNKLMTLIQNNQIDEAYELAFELAAQCEKLTLLARALPHYTGHPQALDRMEYSILKAVPVELQFTDENWFKMRFPALLPKKEKGSPDYVRGFLYPAMQGYFASRPRFHYLDCVIIFRHVYDRRRPERQYRDHDNIEINAVVDLIALFLLDGDMPLRCFHFYMSAAGDVNLTEIIVLTQADFITWLYGEMSGQKDENPEREKPP